MRFTGATACCLLLVSSLMSFSNGFYHLRKTRDAKRTTTSCQTIPQSSCESNGDPLILTKYIDSGDIKLARNLSLVDDLDGYPYPSHSGYFTVQEQYNSNMFFWFFPAQNGNKSAPLILWLQGGPGAPSMFGLFEINGPLYVSADCTLLQRRFNWNLEYNLLYIDNPVRTGFSFTDSDEGLVSNEGEVADNLYKTLQQFYAVFTEYQPNDLYLTGESYAGKYVPAFGVKIHNENQAGPEGIYINLVGIALGNPLNDPVNTLNTYRELYYYLGLVNYQEAQYIETQTLSANILMEQGKFSKANDMINDLLDYFGSVTGLNLLNFMEVESIPEYFVDYIKQPYVRNKIHVGDVAYEDQNEAVVDAFANEEMASQAANFSFLINQGYKTLLYSGIQDISVGAGMTENSIRHLCFNAKDDYLNATKTIWKLNSEDTDIAGYASRAQNFLRVNVRGAGHIVPHDQPERALVMITNFIEDREF